MIGLALVHYRCIDMRTTRLNTRLLPLAVAVLVTAALTSCSAVSATVASCTEAMNGITAAGTAAKDSLATSTEHFTSGDVADPAMASSVAADFTATAKDMTAVADRLGALAGVSSGDVATAAQDASTKWMTTAGDYQDLADAVTNSDVAKIRSLAGSSSPHLSDSSEALQSVISALGSRLKDGDGCS